MRRQKSIREDVASRRITPREQVPPLTLGLMLKRGIPCLEVECTWCRRRGRVGIVAAAAKLGLEALRDDLVQRLRCSACGWFEIEIVHEREPIPGGPEVPRMPPWPPIAEVLAALATVPERIETKRGAIRT